MLMLRAGTLGSEKGTDLISTVAAHACYQHCSADFDTRSDGSGCWAFSSHARAQTYTNLLWPKDQLYACHFFLSYRRYPLLEATLLPVSPMDTVGGGCCWAKTPARCGSSQSLPCPCSYTLMWQPGPTLLRTFSTTSPWIFPDSSCPGKR